MNNEKSYINFVKIEKKVLQNGVYDDIIPAYLWVLLKRNYSY